jgi:hypothetical protein
MPDIAAGPVIGKDCKAYYNSGTHAVPTWNEAKYAINASANLGKGEGDVSGRYSGWKKSKGALKELEISFTYRHKRGTDAVFDAILDSYVNGTPMEWAIMDGDITLSKAQGPRAFCEVMSLNATQELENGVEYEVTLKPTWFEEASAVVEPDWYEVP